MMTRTWDRFARNRWVSGVVVSCAAVLSTAACTQPPNVEISQEIVSPSEVVEGVEPDLVLDIPEGVDPVRVVLAFVLMSTGDIESAVAEGLVSPGEVAIAVQSLEDGTVQEWIDRAEAQATS